MSKERSRITGSPEGSGDQRLEVTADTPETVTAEGARHIAKPVLYEALDLYSYPRGLLETAKLDAGLDDGYISPPYLTL